MARPHRGRVVRPSRQPTRRVLVVTEGKETEPQYIELLNSYLRSRGVTTVVRSVGVGKDPLKVVQQCAARRDEAAIRGKPYDDCVCLVDVDRHKTLNEAAQLAKRERILLLVSNLKFEVWLRWHAEDKRSALMSTQLDDLVAKLGLTNGKNLSSSFPIHAVDKACVTASAVDPSMRPGRIGPNPSSAMPILIKLMKGA